jgi:putative membrane protein
MLMNTPSYPLIILIAMFLTFGAVSCGKSHVEAARENGNTPNIPVRQIMSIDDKNFLINAEKAETRQRVFAAVASDKTDDPAVREFARQVIEDRTRDLDQLMRLMTERNVAQTPLLIEGVELEASQRLNGLSGAVFDHEFLSLITADEQQTVGNFRRAAETSPDPDIRTFASNALPSIRKDFDAAAKLETKLRRQ